MTIRFHIIPPSVHDMNANRLSYSVVNSLSRGLLLTVTERAFLSSITKPAPPVLSTLFVFGTNTEVDSHNLLATNEWPGTITLYKATDRGRHCNLITNALPSLFLKEGMPVVVTYNIDVAAGVVNGAKGTVDACHSDHVVVKISNLRHSIRRVTFTSQRGDARTQFPLKPGFASTVHRLQGQTLVGQIHIDCRHIRSVTSMAVAIGRARTTDQLSLSNVPKRLITPPDCQVALSYLDGNYDPAEIEV